MTRALLIVDVQNDFVEGGALGVDGGGQVAVNISAHLRSGHGYAIVIASRDWHDATGTNGGHFVASGSEPDFAKTWPVHCVAGTDGSDYHRALDIDHVDVHVRKGMGESAYSAFEGVAVDDRSLIEVLEAHGVTDLDIAGLATDYCVRASALDALSLGLRVRILSSMVAGVSADTTVRALKEIALAGAEIV